MKRESGLRRLRGEGAGSGDLDVDVDVDVDVEPYRLRKHIFTLRFAYTTEILVEKFLGDAKATQLLEHRKIYS